MTTQEILEAARSAKSALALADNTARNAALLGMADALCDAQNQSAILAANAEDMGAAKGHISDVMLDRLALTVPRIEAMAQGIREVAALPDPVGRVLNRVERPNGLVIEKTAVPMGVIAIIYESRPNVTSDAAALAIKSGNACILRCGKEAWRSAHAIVTALRQGLKKAGLPETAVCLIEDTTHASANALMTAVGYVDLLIPIWTKLWTSSRTQRPAAPACATPRKCALCTLPLPGSSCPVWPSGLARTVLQRVCTRWICGWISAPPP